MTTYDAVLGLHILLVLFGLMMAAVIHGLLFQMRWTVELQHGGEIFTAKVLAVSPDPHVALLRIHATFNPLPISLQVPKPGETVTFSPASPGSARSAAVITYGGPGGSTHLTFSLAVPNSDDGAPVLDPSGRVVGIAEPSAQFQAHEVGFAGFVPAACAAVAPC